jgi:hypothetical protein
VNIEFCGRCSAAMEWRHGTWQCTVCRFKLGCCEGEPQSGCYTQVVTTSLGAEDSGAEPAGLAADERDRDRSGSTTTR